MFVNVYLLPLLPAGPPKRGNNYISFLSCYHPIAASSRLLSTLLPIDSHDYYELKSFSTPLLLSFPLYED